MKTNQTNNLNRPGAPSSKTSCAQVQVEARTGIFPVRAFLCAICVFIFIGCGDGAKPSHDTTGPISAKITELQVFYGVNYGDGPGYLIRVVFENTGDFDIANAYWHIYGEPYTWIVDLPRLYIYTGLSIAATTEIFRDSFYGLRYFTISLYDQNDHMLTTKTVISEYI